MDPGSSIIFKEITVFLMLKHEGEEKIKTFIVVLLFFFFFSESKGERGRASFLFFCKDLETALHPVTPFLQKLDLLQEQLVLT